jgi:hypothetical protein
MSSAKPQTFKSHASFDPYFHVILFLVLIVNLIFAGFYLVQHQSMASAWFLMLSVVAFIPFFKLRTYPLKVQDRVIRLEERLRLQALAPPEWHPQIYRLSEDQLIGLRFACDEEIVELAKQALAENLSRKQIKERIKNWRPDNWRV